MYIFLIIGISGVLGYGLGILTVIISRKINGKRKVKVKHSFNKEYDIQIPCSDVSRYKHDKEEHSTLKF